MKDDRKTNTESAPEWERLAAVSVHDVQHYGTEQVQRQVDVKAGSKSNKCFANILSVKAFWSW